MSVLWAVVIENELPKSFVVPVAKPCQRACLFTKIMFALWNLYVTMDLYEITHLLPLHINETDTRSTPDQPVESAVHVKYTIL